MADVVLKEVTELIDKELAAANDKFGLNHSNHESFAVLREEIDEAIERATEIEERAAELWQGIKENDPHRETRKRFSGVYASAAQLAIEAIQVAAMARKGILSNLNFTEEDERGENA